MNDSRFTQKQIDFKESQVSQFSKYDFEIKSQTFTVDQASINKSIIDACISEKQYSDTPQVTKKLYINELQNHKEKSQESRISVKQNSIPINPQQSYSQSRKITIHKNNSVIPFRNSGVDESFTTNKIVQLQEQLLQLRKQMSLKQSSWIKEKSLLLNKMEIANYDLAEIKQRNNNLIQINQTLTQTLGQTGKSYNQSDYDKRIEECMKQLQQKTKKIQFLEENISQLEKEKVNLDIKLKEQKEKNQFISKNLQDYKAILKQSNQRKFQSDQRIVILNKNIQLLKKKLTQLPIKESYLHPIFVFLDSMKEGDNKIMANNQSRAYHDNSEVKRQKQMKFFKPQKMKYKEQDSFVQPEQNFFSHKTKYGKQDSDYSYNDESYDVSQENNFDLNSQNTSYFSKPSGKNLFQAINPHVKRIDTEENQYQNDSNNGQYQDQQEQVYLCEVCQRVYPHEEFLGHMKECRQYEALLKQKKVIQSKLISIKEQEYDNRKSNVSSLNSSTIMMNKSRSKGKFVKPSDNSYKVDKGYDRQSIQRRDKTNQNGNRTQRYFNDDHNDNSRLQLSQLLNMSDIGNRQSNVNPKGQDKKSKKSLINHNNYFTGGQQNQQNQHFQLINDNFTYKPKHNPEIKYQTTIEQNNIGKQSMQQEIRRIVQAMNDGRKSIGKQNGYMQKSSKHMACESKATTARNTMERMEKNQKRQSQVGNGGRNFDKPTRSRAEFY